MSFNKSKEKDYAKVLFVGEKLDQKTIAVRVGVTEKTLSKWVNEGDWHKLRKSLLNTRQNMLCLLYDQLDWATNNIATRKPVYDAPFNLIEKAKTINEAGELEEKYKTVKAEDYPLILGNTATSKEADAILKLSAAIKNMEWETGVGEMVQVFIGFIDFVQQTDFDLSLKISTLSDLYIKTKIK